MLITSLIIPCCRGIPKIIVFVGGYLTFMCIGALMFLALELEEGIKQEEKIRNLNKDFMDRNPCVRLEDFQTIIRSVEVANKMGIRLSHNFSHWDFSQSVLFVGTIVTTIGYGGIVPVTKSGKIFTILVSIIGIPLTLGVLSAFVDRMLLPSRCFLQWLILKIGSSHSEFLIRLLHLLIVLITAVVIFFLLPAIVFYNVEPSWDFLDAIYFCFLSITSIGLGDLTPGDSGYFSNQSNRFRFVYKILTTVYLYMGVSYMMFALAVFYEIPELNITMLYCPEGDHYFEEHMLREETTTRDIEGSNNEGSISTTNIPNSNRKTTFKM